MTARVLPLRRYPEPDQSSDPRVRAVVSSLRALPVEDAPLRVDFRAELRSQLVSITPRLVGEGERDRVRSGDTEARLGDHSRRRFLDSTFALARPFAIGAVAACVLLALLGSLVAISGSAIPGDALYGVKRTAETVRLNLAGGDTGKAEQYLAMARTRADEAQQLLSRSTAMALGTGPSAAGALNSVTAQRVTDVLADADSETRSASTLLTTEAVQKRTDAPLSVLATWAPGQAQRLTAVVDRLPAGPVKQRASASLALVEQAQARSMQLQSMIGAPCLSASTTDPLGAVACGPSATTGTRGSGGTAPTAPAAPATPGGTTGSPTRSTSGGAPGSAGTASTGTAAGGASASSGSGGQPHGSAAPAGSGPIGTLVPTAIPPLPPILPTQGTQQSQSQTTGVGGLLPSGVSVSVSLPVPLPGPASCTLVLGVNVCK